MPDSGIVLAMWERDVYRVGDGSLMRSLTAVTLYRQPHPIFVLTREILTPNATAATVSYTVIPGTTIKECCESLVKMSLMILSPVSSLRKNGLGMNS